MRPRILTAVSLSSVLWLLPGGACSRNPSVVKARSDQPTGLVADSPSDSARMGAIVATVGTVPIRARQVALEMRRLHVDARRGLENLVTFELLAQAAAHAHVELTATDLQAIQSVRVQRLLEREIEPQLEPSAVPEADLRALYERNKKRFVHGHLVKVAVLSLFTGARMKPEPRALAQENARMLKAFVDAGATKPRADLAEAFEAIAKDPVWINRRVNLTTVWQGEDEPFPAVVGRAVRGLSRPGDTTGLVGDETGYYIARYLSDLPPENVAFSVAEPGMREEIHDPWRHQQFLRLSTAFGDHHEIEIFPGNFPLLADDSVTP